MTQKPLALLSVTDKTEITTFARELVLLGYEIISTGGTAALLRESEVPCTDASDYTQSPEILGGRVKTLHPKIHGGILFDRTHPHHLKEIRSHSIRPIDLVVVNLYDFKAKGKGLDLPEAIEFIDIGGPTMLRAAAKNYLSSAPIIDPADYSKVLSQLKEGGLTLEFRRQLAAKTFRSIANYDSMIASSFEDSQAPEITLSLTKVQNLRYGENPHQKAVFYTGPDSVAGGLQNAVVLQGKELSYNNLLDIDAAAALVADFPEYQAVAIIKHTNPCGMAIAVPGSEALHVTYQKALEADPKSAFGGIVAFNAEVDAETAAMLLETFLECIVAPKFSGEAITTLAKKKNLRLLQLPYLESSTVAEQFELKSITGGFLWQTKDQERLTKDAFRLVTKTKLRDEDTDDLIFAQRVCKHVKSNAIVYARKGQTLAVGAGQMSRIDSARFAAEKAREFGRPLEGAVMASDAFFPFRDNVDSAAAWGIKAIIQPGGSVRDEETIQAADEHGIAMVFTGIRHFKH
jgi:phosphoribosylaminoimidazolecarboxamide formyltransferase/IMP cyclohydrolase